VNEEALAHLEAFAPITKQKAVGSSVRDADIRDGFIGLGYEHCHCAIGIAMLHS
jgi:hypothetical protein